MNNDPERLKRLADLEDGCPIQVGGLTNTEVRRAYTISSTVSPPISGYGGFDEWELPDLTNSEADEFLKGLQILVEKYGGQFTGSN